MALLSCQFGRTSARQSAAHVGWRTFARRAHVAASAHVGRTSGARRGRGAYVYSRVLGRPRSYDQDITLLLLRLLLLVALLFILFILDDGFLLPCLAHHRGILSNPMYM